MKRKIITAVGSDSICKLLINNGYEVIDDIPYQDGVLQILKKTFTDIIILSEELEGDFDKYIFIDKIKEIDSKVKIIMIVFSEDENYKKFLYSKGIFNIFIDGKSSDEELLNVLSDNMPKNAYKFDLSKKNALDIKQHGENKKNALKSNLMPKFQKQQVLTFAGCASTGKTTLAVQTAMVLAKYNLAKVLLIDFDTENAGISYVMGIDRGPKNPEYVLSPDKNSSLNYMIDAIDKRNFDVNIFEKYVIKSKQFSNLDILTGNKSLYISKNVLNFEYYTKILECAKSLYDFIVIDTSSNVFLDSIQFSLINANKIFFVTEGNYIALYRANRLLREIFTAWGVPKSKIHVLINKYSKKSLDKLIIKDMIKEYPNTGYISFSDKYEEAINSIDPVLPKEVIFELYEVLGKYELIPEIKYLSKVKGFFSKVGGRK